MTIVALSEHDVAAKVFEKEGMHIFSAKQIGQLSHKQMHQSSLASISFPKRWGMCTLGSSVLDANLPIANFVVATTRAC